MKTFKKIGIGLVLLVSVLADVIIFGAHNKVLAAAPITLPDKTLTSVSFTFVDSGNITAAFPGGTTITYTDGKPLNGNRDYGADKSNFCLSSDLNQDGGSTINGFKNSDVAFGTTQAATIQAKISINVVVGGVTGTCTHISQDIHINNQNNAAGIYLVANGGGVTDVNNKTPMTLVPNTQNSTQLGTSSLYAADPTDSSGCLGNTVAFIETSNGSSVANIYTLGSGVLGGNPASKNPTIGSFFQSSNCVILGETDNVGVSGTPGIVQLGQACTSGADCDTVTGTCTKAGGDCVNGTGPTAPSCESNTSAISLSWIVCPILGVMDSAAGIFFNFVEDQLCFNTGASSSTGGDACSSQSSNKSPPNNLTPQVEQAWGVFRVIATALLVIVMLVMVISQAIGAGPFDAYTVRKTLPKLVTAAILIQLSWVMLKYAIDLSNDLGRGIADLMFAPFGGKDNMSLDKIVGSTWKVATGNNGAFQFFTVFAATAGALANIPGLLALAAFALIAILTGFVVLVLRKLLIVFLVILAPLAFVLWVLPGTQNYWKMWRENFTKILLMFPMIMGLLAAGRIFAYVASGAGNSAGGVIFKPHLATAHLAGLPVPYIADIANSAQGFADLAIVVFAFFGPYLLLPKTFQWGGSIMGSAARTLQNSQIAKDASKKTQEGFRGFGERKITGKFAKKYDPGASLGSRVGYSIMGGRVIPTKYRQALLAQKGDKWNEEREAEAKAVITREGEKARPGYETKLRMDDGSEAVYKREVDPSAIDPETGQAQERFLSKEFEETGEGEKYTDDESRAAKRAAAPGEKADTKMLNGVAAMKQMWVDKSEDGKDEYERKVAVKLLRSTSSWPELEGSFTKNGKRVVDTDIWNPTVTTDPESYPAVLRSRVDHVPHLDDKAKKTLAAEETRRAAAGEAKMTQAQRQDFVSGKRLEYAIRDQMSNEDFATQSDGFWEEAKRVSFDKDGNMTEQGKVIQGELRKRFAAIHAIGGTAPQQLLGHLAGGGSLHQSVNAVITGEAKTPAANPDGVLQYIDDKRAHDQKVEDYKVAQTEAAPEPSGLTRVNVQNMTTENVTKWVQESGGYRKMADQDLVMIYNTRRDAAQQAARQELQRRNFNPRAARAEQQAAAEAAAVAAEAADDEGTIIIPRTYRPRGDRDDDNPPNNPPPPNPSSGGGGGPPPAPPTPPSSGTVIEPDTPPEEFGPGGKFPPPNIPPGPTF